MARVQGRATKQINSIKEMGYEDRFKQLKLPTLVYRRMIGNMIKVFKILNNIYDPEVLQFDNNFKHMRYSIRRA